MEIHLMVFIDKWSLFGGYIFPFSQGRVVEVVSNEIPIIVKKYCSGNNQFLPFWPM